MKRAVILLCAAVLALTALAASSNRKETSAPAPVVHASDAGVMRTLGEQRFRANCGRCHAAPQKFPPRAMATVLRHMRVRATITDEDMRLVLFLHDPVDTTSSMKRIRHHSLSLTIAGLLVSLTASAFAQPRIIELTADHDSRYRIAGQKTPEITVRAGETFVLRVTARRGKSWNRDGSIHGFALLRSKDHSKVDGWDLLFKPGTQEFLLTAPAEPGEYEAVCTVICSEDHEGMHLKFNVVP